jgi:hypothetical protein
MNAKSQVMRKTVLVLLLLLVPSVSLARYSGGSGEPNDPYRIATPEDLNDIGNHPEDFNDCFILVNNINMAGFIYSTALIAPDIDNSTAGFQGTPFTGIFDGNDCNICNLTIDTTGARNDYLGLFGQIEKGQVRNLRIDVNVAGGDNSALFGGLCGESRWQGTISKCYATGSVSGGAHSGHIGGLCGRALRMSNCYATGSVTAGDDSEALGGLCGEGRGINNCYATGDVNGGYNSLYVGGLCGWHYLALISNCYGTGPVTAGAESTSVGGLCGQTSSDSTISNCYSTGPVTAGAESTSVGGLVGEDRGITSNCYATGGVSGGSSVGGLVGRIFGYRTTISYCYAAGDVSGSSNVGGLVGQDEDALYTSCFWDSATNPDVNGIGNGQDPNVIAKTTAEMQTQSTFTDYGWDFVGETINDSNDIWTIKEGFDYPRHVWKLVNFVGWDGVDFADYSYLADHWWEMDCGNSNDCNGTDLDFSDALDWADLKIFCEYWLEAL